MLDVALWLVMIGCVFWIVESLLRGYLTIAELRDRRDEKRRKGRAR